MALPTRLRRRVPSLESRADEVVIGSIWMLLATLAVSVGSFVFWLAAARMTDADVIGRSAGLFSAVFFLSYATSLGLPVAVGRHASSPSPIDTLRFRLALAATAVTSVIGATVFVLIDPSGLLDPVMAHGFVLGWLVLTLLSVGVAVSVLVDVRLMGHRRWQDVFLRSSAIALIRLPPLLLAVADESGFWIFVIAAGGFAVTALPYLPSLVRGADTGRVDWEQHRDAIRFAGVNYASQLAVQSPLFVTPLVVALSVGDEENATFYLSWGVMTVVYLGIHHLGRTLLVEGSKPRAEVALQARSTLALGFLVTVPAAVLSVPVAPVVERIYGAEHEEMSVMLPLLMAGTVPWVVTRTSLAVARTLGDTWRTLAVAGWSALSVLAGVAIGGIIGDATTASAGWLLGSLASLVVSAPILWNQLWGSDS